MADRLVTSPMTSRDLERSRSWPRYEKCPLSRICYAHYPKYDWRYAL